MPFAPIVLFVYNRPRHTRQTIEALQKNHLAQESQLFIYSDAPKDKNAEENVKEVRKYIKKTVCQKCQKPKEKPKVNQKCAKVGRTTATDCFIGKVRLKAPIFCP